jgi:hypothetical protein
MMMEEEHIVTYRVTVLLITFIKPITSRSCIPMWTRKMHMRADDRSNSVQKEYLIVLCTEPTVRIFTRTQSRFRIAHVGSACFFVFACGFCWE